MTYNPTIRNISQRYSNNCPAEIFPPLCPIKHTCANPYFVNCKKKQKPTNICCSSSSSSSDCFYSTTSDSYICLSDTPCDQSSDSSCNADLGDDLANEICLCIDFTGKIGQGCLNDILTSDFCDGDKCLLIDTGVLLVWCSYDNSWKFCNPQPCTPYYYYDTDNYKIWVVEDYGDPAEEFTVDEDLERFTIYDYCNDETYHKVADKWILGCDRL